MKKKLHPAFSIFTFSRFHIFTFKILSRLLFISILAHQHINTFAQDSSHIRISLLTCTPGEELYSTFGHTAIRVTDSNSVTDNVFNYGTFNFDAPGFYTKFIRGKLLYYLSVENFREFAYDYQAERRGITEQVLNMSADEKITMMEALYENSKEENRYYQYDFFLDNCTTRPRDMIVKYKKDHPAFKWVMPKGTRFRQAIHLYLDKNEKDWSKLGIDLLLGAPTDAVMTIGQSQFLPDNLMKSLDSSNNNHRLVVSTGSLYPFQPAINKGSILTPMFVFSLLFVIIVSLSFLTNKGAKIFLQGFDGLFFFLVGALGIMLIFMWIATDHSMTKDNYNLLWAWPFNIIIAFFVNSKAKWVKLYFGISMVALLIVLLSWFFLPQQMNNALIPLVLLLAFRSSLKYFTPSFSLAAYK
ncbi:MAG: hypothetical protein JWP81_1467 [Ferruginibacter sp.]|nr:hypothetical protein [Ferruginibacter sp.]